MKSTRIEFGPDDPIFRAGIQIFKPISRPSTIPDEPDPKETEPPMEDE
jgi:hypothetical protein